MKRLLFIAGLLLLSPGAAYALTPGCQQALALPSVGSRYVGQVLLRAELSLDYAKTIEASQTPDPLFALTVPDWVQSILATAVQLVDESLTLTQHARRLENASACLAFDAFQLQCEAQKILESLRVSLANSSPNTIILKQALLLFVRDRLAYLLQGGADENFVDDQWGRRQVFDIPTPVWCCPGTDTQNTCTQMTKFQCNNLAGEGFDEKYDCEASKKCGTVSTGTAMCPYHSDYLPASGDGFGCDASVLGPRSSYQPMSAELSAMQMIMKQLGSAASVSLTLAQLQEQILRLAAGNPLAPSSVPTSAGFSHRQGFGCLNRAGVCEGASSILCADDETCALEDAGNCRLAAGYCTGNINQGCATDANCGNGLMGTCATGEPPVPAKVAARGPFAARENVFTMLQNFLRQRVGAGREYPDSLKLSSEFQPGQRAESDLRRDDGPFAEPERSAARAALRDLQRKQGAAEAALFPRSTDGPERVTAELGDLRQAAGRLAQLASSPQGLRSFVTRYAYFLRVSCVHRPCAKKLEEAINIASTDACFRYANGSFLDDTAADPGWLQCAKRACVRLPDAILDKTSPTFSSLCECYVLQPGNIPYPSTPATADFCVPK